MLRKITEILKDRGALSLKELALAMQMEQSALEPILELLIDKNRIELLKVVCSGKDCSGCHCADRGDMMIYRFSGN